MRIMKYDFNYGRRTLLEKTVKGVAAAGVLAPLWPLIARSADDISKAYPDELLSIEAYTKGKIKPGDVVDANNVDIVKDLLDPIAYQQIKSMGRKINIVESTKDVTKMFPYQYLEATLKHKGNAIIGPDGNVWDKKAGTPWIGGNPFPDPKTGIEAIANLTLSWGRHNYYQSALPSWNLGPDGSVDYRYDFMWIELQVAARPDGTIWHGESNLLRYNTTFFTAPQDTAGSSFLNVWYYDQHKFPDLYGYLPVFRRVRQYPTNQRFQPLAPGMTLFLSDAWAAGDPMLTWGNYKIITRKPMLGAIGSANFRGGYDPNWGRGVHGGPKGQTFFDTYFELIPECIVMEDEPVHYPRAPVSKRRIWIDVRSGVFVASVTYDRRGQIWKSFEPGFAQYSNSKMTITDPEDGHPLWNWAYVHIFDIQSNRMTRYYVAKEIAGGYRSQWGAQGVDVFNKYLTVQALERLGGQGT